MTSLKKLAALLGAGALVFAIVGTALAIATVASTKGVTPTSVDNNIKLVVTEGGQDQAACARTNDAQNPREGIETGAVGGQATSPGGVTVAWVYNTDTKAVSFTATGGVVTIAYIKGGNSGYNIYNYVGVLGHGVASDGNLFAPNTGSKLDHPAGLSHAVFCTTPGGSEPTPTPTFNASQAGATDAPTLPNTATVGGNGTSGPADGAWLLVVALGVLLASIVVLTPARAKSRR